MRLSQLKWEPVEGEQRLETAMHILKTNGMVCDVKRKKYAKTTSIEVTVHTRSGTLNDTFTCNNLSDLEIYLNEKENEEPEELDIDTEEE